MKLKFLSISLLTYFLSPSFQAFSDTPPFPIFGPCQRRCIKQFGEITERQTNIDTKYIEVNVHNKTEFSLCKLGCNSPEYADLHIPAFRFGQSSYQDILARSSMIPTRTNNVVRDVSILCLDTSTTSQSSENVTSSVPRRVLSGTVILTLDEQIDVVDSVHFVEIVARNGEDIIEETNVVFQDWCYSSNCNVTFFTPIEMNDLQIRVRLSTFDENGPVGGIVMSKWYSMNHILAGTSIDLRIIDVEWNDDKAAARLSLDQANSILVPICSMQLLYKTTVSSEFKSIDFHLDQTRQFLLKKLEFQQSYHLKLVGGNSSNQVGNNLAIADFDVPECRKMVDDWTMCAPPPVSDFQSTWNTTSTSGHSLIITWSYITDATNLSLIETNSKVSMSHFNLQLNALITPKNENCEKLETIRRDVTWTHRKVVFYVPDAECNYEAEIYAMDTKQRKSYVKKIKISQINEPSYMSLLLANDISLSIGFIGTAIFALILLVFVAFLFVQRRKKDGKKVDETPYDNGDNRLVYAFVDGNNSSRTVIGVRPLSTRYSSDTSVSGRNGNYGQNNSRLYAYSIADQTQRVIQQNELHPYIQYQTREPTFKNLRVGGDMMATSTPNIDDDHPYETITDYLNESDISDDVFEDEVPIPSPSASIKAITQKVIIAMPPIAPYDEYDDLPAFLFQDLQLTKTYDVEGNPPWRLTNVVDVMRGGSYGLKYGADYSVEVREAIRKELRFLTKLHYHQNCVRFDGIVIGRWENIKPQVIGILLENCRGGSLRKYVQSVGSIFRRQAINSPNNQTPESANSSRTESSPSPPSSGYDSLIRNTKPGSESKADRSAASISLRFCQFAEQISSALEHLHRTGIVHTRVTTISIYLYRDYTDPLDMLCDQIVKLGDFGNAASSAEEVVVDQNLQPPEVAMGKRYEAKGDIWQFGTCLVEMASLGLTYQVQKDPPLAGVDEFDALSSTKVLQEAAKKCLNARNRPSASDLRAVFQTDTARDLKAMNLANLEQINQSLLV